MSSLPDPPAGLGRDRETTEPQAEARPPHQPAPHGRGPCPPPDPSPKRRQILDGAALVFDRSGFEGASMSKIADEAGVSKGTLYNYFAGKSELFSAFVEEMTRTRLAWILDTGSAGDDVEAALRLVARRLIDTMMSPEAHMLHRIVVSEAGQFPHLAAVFFEAVQRRVGAEIAAWLEGKNRAGLMRVPDGLLAAEQFMALCKTRLWMRRCLHQPEPDTGEDEVGTIVDATVRMFLNTYGVTE